MKELTECHDMRANPWNGANSSRFTVMKNKSGLRKPSVMVIIVVSALLALFAVQTVVAQERTVKAEGILTEVSSESVIINNGGYIISRLTRVLDMDGNRMKIEDMRVPVKVKFEYKYTEKGPVILWIRAVGV